jgi:hypothetical protein
MLWEVILVENFFRSNGVLLFDAEEDALFFSLILVETEVLFSPRPPREEDIIKGEVETITSSPAVVGVTQRETMFGVPEPSLSLA